MKQAPKVCILLATYNGGKYLGEQLDSLIAQTYRHFNLLVHDDNSDDATVEIVKRYQNRYPEKISLLEDEIATGSAVKNFSYLLAHKDAGCDYVMFCDQDDVWLPTKIEETLARMQEEEKTDATIPLLVYTDANIAREDLQITAASLYADRNRASYGINDIRVLALENHILGCTVMMNAELADLLHDMPEEAVMHDWWAALTALKEGGRIVFLDKPTLLYRQHGNNVCGAADINVKYFLVKLFYLKRYLASFDTVIRQMRKRGIEMPWYEIMYRKSAMILRRVLHVWS